MRTLFYLRMAAIMSFFILALWLPTGVSAAQSGNQCDTSGPKYWCTHITYDISGSTYTAHSRDWEGGRDGGAQQWHLLFARDYSECGGCWSLQRDYGASGWLTNVSLGPWWCYCDDDALANGGLVSMQLEYYECDSTCHYWTSDLMYHFLT
jgi:hypothetical protein